jgi:hypothetical protein
MLIWSLMENDNFFHSENAGQVKGKHNTRTLFSFPSFFSTLSLSAIRRICDD